MFVDHDGACDRESLPTATPYFLGGEEWIVDLIDDVTRNAATVVFELQFNPPLYQRGSDHDRASLRVSTGVRERVCGIHDEVQKHLTKLTNVAYDLRNLSTAHMDRRDIFVFIACDEKRRLDRSIEVRGSLLGRVWMGELLHRTNDARHPLGTFNDSVDRARDFFAKERQIHRGVRILWMLGDCKHLVKGGSEKMHTIANVLNGRIDFVCDSRGEPTHRFQLLCQAKFNLDQLTKARLLAQLGHGLFQVRGLNSNSLFEGGNYFRVGHAVLDCYNL
jgi:hypothetical protein